MNTKSIQFSKCGTCLVFVSLSFCSFGIFNRLERAFEALQRYDYFKAKVLFEKSLERNPVAASYGLSLICGRRDNPFYNLKKSYRLIELAQAGYAKLSDERKEALAEYRVNLVTITAQENHLYEAFYAAAKQKNDLKAIVDYLQTYPKSHCIPDAKRLRDSLAFAIAEQADSYQAYRAFYRAYPRAAQADEARKRYRDRVFQSKVGNGTLQGYLDFVKAFPNNPHVSQAWDAIYDLCVTTGSERQNRYFIRHYPDSPAVNRAWEEIQYINLPGRDYAAFLKKYPEASKAVANRYRHLTQNQPYPFLRDGKLGFVNANGRIVTPPQYDFVNDFSEGLALVADSTHVGYIDFEGRTVVPLIYDEGSDFHTGLAIVEKGQRFGVVDHRGNLIVPVSYDAIEWANEGFISVEKDGIFTYLNRRGKDGFGKNFTAAEPFFKGSAIVGVGDEKGVIDTAGNWVIKPEFLDLQRLSNGNYIAKTPAGYTVLDASGAACSKGQYDFIGGEGDGRIIIENGGRFGYADLNAEVCIAPRFSIYPGYTRRAAFENGYAQVRYRGKFGLIDKRGKRIFSCLYDSIGSLKNFPVACKRNGKWGYVRRNSTQAIPYIYDVAKPFDKQLAVVAKNGKFGLIAEGGHLLAPLQYEHLERASHGLFIGRQGAYHGVLDARGKTLVPFVFDRIERVNDDLIRLIAGGQYSYYDTRRQRLVYGAVPPLQ